MAGKMRRKMPAKGQGAHSLLLLAVLCLLGLMMLCAGCGKTANADQTTWGRADAKEIDVNSKIAGRVVELLVKEGDTVQQGQVIARIDKRSLEAQKAEAEASIKALRAQQAQAAVTTNMQSGTTASAVSEAQAATDQARADLALAQADHDRYAELLAEGAVSQQTFEQFDTKYKTAQAAYEQSKAAVRQAQAGTLQTDASRANEEALAMQIEKAEATLQNIEVSLDETEIRAPFDGVITQKYIEEGSMISNGTPLVAVQDPEDNWIDIKVPETKLSKYYVGQEVTMIGRDGGTKVTGTITDISKKAEFATQRATSERGDETDIVSFNVKVQVNSDVLRPGMRFRLEGLDEDREKSSGGAS